MKRTRNTDTPPLIRDAKDFDSGALTGRTIGQHGLSPADAGWLSGPDLDAFRTDCSAIRYVVWSFYTPIAWRTLSGRWHVVSQRFSPITSTKHQSRLYLIPRD